MNTTTKISLRRKGTIGFAVCLLAGLLLVPAGADARYYVQVPYLENTRPLLLEFHGGYLWEGQGFNTGARVGIAVMQNGFIRDLNNAIYLNFGADFYYSKVPGLFGHQSRYHPAVGFPLAVSWEFYFSEKWSAFFEVGVNFFLDHYLLEGKGPHPYAAQWVLVAVGGRYQINNTLGIVLRIGLPYTAFGLTFSL